MAGIKYILQNEVFDPLDERILSICNVSKLYKKRKNSYLCITTTTKVKSLVTLCQIKQQDKGVYKKKRVWNLEEIKVVDGKSENTETHEFDLLLEKLYKWFAPNLHEKQNLITILYRQIHKHVHGEKAIFKNIPKTWLLESTPDKILVTEKLNENIEVVDDSEIIEDFQTLTDKEESELNVLLTECTSAVSNAEKFMETLGKNLQDLDGANVQSVLASEKQVDALMEHIETAIDEAEKIEQRLDSYDEILCHIRETMEKMGEKNAMIEIANNNNINLLQELERVILHLEIPPSYQISLTDTDLTSASGLQTAILAGKALQNAMNSDIDPALMRLTAIQDQSKRFEKWKAKFSQTISRHLNNLFIHLGNDHGEQSTQAGSDLILPKHTNIHKELQIYGELMHWTKVMDRKAYDGLAKVYTLSLSKVYEREIKSYFEQARIMVMGSRDEMTSSISSKSKSLKVNSIPYGILGINREQWSVGVDPYDRQRYDNILERILNELQPVALSEQQFCISFFQLDVLSPVGRNSRTTLDQSNISEGVSNKDQCDSVVALPQKKIDRQINEEVRRMMGELFSVLEKELLEFICGLEKLDNL